MYAFINVFSKTPLKAAYHVYICMCVCMCMYIVSLLVEKGSFLELIASWIALYIGCFYFYFALFIGVIILYSCKL